MTETPREYKKRIDDTRAKRRINRDMLIECIQEYELVDERYKAETAQEILANFDKNEKAEKSDELYVRVGKELLSIDLKYKELKDLKEELKSKRDERETLKKELKAINIECEDETTLMMQMKKVESINSKIEEIDEENKKLEKKVDEREKEIKEIEETYGKKEDINETLIKDGKKQGTKKPQAEITKEESPKTLQEYKEKVLAEKGKTDNIKGKIIKLLEEGTGIDETLKEKIKGKISDVFEKYNDEIEGSLKMKSARYIEDRNVILDMDAEIKIIGGKPCYAARRDGKYCIVWGEEQLGNEYDKIKNLQEIGGRPYFEGLRDGGDYDIMRGNKVMNTMYIEKLGCEGHLKFEKSIGGRPFITIILDKGQLVAMWGEEQLGGKYSEIEDLQEIGGKPYFRGLRDDGYNDIIWGNSNLKLLYNEKFTEGKYTFSIKGDVGGRPFIVLTLKDSKKQIAMWGEEQLGKEYKEIKKLEEFEGRPHFEGLRDDGDYDIVRGNKVMNTMYIEKFGCEGHLKFEKSIGGRPFITFTLDNGQQVAMWGEKQLGKEYKEIKNIQVIGGKPCFLAKDNGNYDIIRGNEQIGNTLDNVGNVQDIGGKPCFRANRDGKWCLIWGKEQQGDLFDDVLDPIEIGGKPYFLAVENGKKCAMRGNEQLGDLFDEIDEIIDIGGKPYLKAKKDGIWCIMRGTEQMGDLYDNTFDLKDIGGKPCFIVKKGGKQCVMQGEEQLGGKYSEIEDLQEIGGKPYFRGLRDDGYNDIIWGNSNLKLLYNEKFTEGKYTFSIKGDVGGRPFIVITLDDSKKQIAMWGEEQLGKEYKEIKKIQEIGGIPCFEGLRNDGHYDIIWGNENLKLGYNERFTEGKYHFEIKESVGGRPFIVITLDDSKKQIAMWGEEQLGKEYKEIDDLQEIGGKPYFRGLRDDGHNDIIWGNENLKLGYNERFTEGKYCFEIKKSIGGKPFIVITLNDSKKEIAMWGEEQQGNEYDDISSIKEIGGKPVFTAKKDGKWCIMKGNEQLGNWVNYESDLIKDEIIEKYQQNKNNEDTVIQKEGPKDTPREKREKIILERYQKKLNRDELLKTISRIRNMDDKAKKTLKSEILSNFMAEFKKATSTEEFKELDKEYRELKKSERQKAKKSAELETEKEISKPKVAKLDEKLVEIANSAMKLEDDSRLKIIKSKKLGKAKEEWNTLESRLNEILDKVKKLHKEEVELTGIYSEKEKKYGKKSERPEIKGKALKKDTVAIEKLEAESTFLGHKKAYMELVNYKEKYVDDFLKEIETTDFGISDEKKKDVMEKLKIALEKELDVFREGDDITKLADETEKWLKENWKTVMEQMDGLNRKIQEKEKEIKEFKSKGTGDDSKDIYKNKHEGFKLQKELLTLKNQYNSIKTELEEKLKNYDGTVINWTDQIYIETRDEKNEREETERREKIETEESNKILGTYRSKWYNTSFIDKKIKRKIFDVIKKIPLKVEITADGSRTMTFKLGGKKYTCFDTNIEGSKIYGYIFDFYGINNEIASQRIENKNRNTRLFSMKKQYANEILHEIGKAIKENDIKVKTIALMNLLGIYGESFEIRDDGEMFAILIGDCFDFSSGTRVSITNMLK